jgi:hypothetical protein
MTPPSSTKLFLLLLKIKSKRLSKNIIYRKINLKKILERMPGPGPGAGGGYPRIFFLKKNI